MGDNEVNVGSHHPLGKRVWHGLWQCAAVGSPREHHLRTAAYGVLADGYEVGKGLQGVNGGRLHGYHGLAAVAHELADHGFGIVVGAVGESCEGAHGYDVAVACHDGDCFEQVFRLVAVHDYPSLGFQLPCSGVHVEHYHVHAQVHGSLLSAQSGAQRVVEENHQQGLVLAQLLPGKAVALHLLCLGERLVEVAKVVYVEKCSHCRMCFLFSDRRLQNYEKIVYGKW